MRTSPYLRPQILQSLRVCPVMWMPLQGMDMAAALWHHSCRSRHQDAGPTQGCHSFNYGDAIVETNIFR